MLISAFQINRAYKYFLRRHLPSQHTSSSRHFTKSYNNTLWSVYVYIHRNIKSHHEMDGPARLIGSLKFQGLYYEPEDTLIHTIVLYISDLTRAISHDWLMPITFRLFMDRGHLWGFQITVSKNFKKKCNLEKSGYPQRARKFKKVQTKKTREIK